MRSTLSSRFALLLLSALMARTGMAQDLPELRIRAVAERALGEVPGLSVAVGIDGEVAWTGAFGAAALDPRVPATAATRFRIYSVSKPWTAAAGLRLAVAGRLDADAPISLPGFPDKGIPITAYQLGTHTAGIRHYREGEATTNRRCETVGEAVALFADDPLLFPPGTDRAYSTWGFVLLSAVIEQAAGAPFDSVLRQEVLAPAGMIGTVHSGTPTAGVARAYERKPGGGYRDVTDSTNPSCKWGGGGYLATAADLARFPLAALSGALLPPSAVDLLFDDAEGAVQGTGGSGPGGAAWVRTDLGSGLVVAIAANAGGALDTLERVANRIAAEIEATEAVREPSPSAGSIAGDLSAAFEVRVPVWLRLQ